MLLTQALAEKKLTAKKKIENQFKKLETASTRLSNEIDPYESKGGGKEYVKSLLTSIKDLQDYYLRLSTAVQCANASNVVEIGGHSRTIAEWIIYKNSLADLVQHGYRNADISLLKADNTAKDMNKSRSSDDSVSVVFNLDKTELADMRSDLMELTSNIDSSLSIANATITVDLT